MIKLMMIEQMVINKTKNKLAVSVVTTTDATMSVRKLASQKRPSLLHPSFELLCSTVAVTIRS